MTEKTNKGRYISKEDMQERVNEVYGRKYWIVTDYNGSSKPITVMCPVCRTERTLTRCQFFLKGDTHCVVCDPELVHTNRLKFDDVAERVDKASEGQYELLEIIKGSTVLLQKKGCKCPPYKTTLGRFINRGQRQVCKCKKNKKNN